MNSHLRFLTIIIIILLSFSESINAQSVYYGVSKKDNSDTEDWFKVNQNYFYFSTSASGVYKINKLDNQLEVVFPDKDNRFTSDFVVYEKQEILISNNKNIYDLNTGEILSDTELYDTLNIEGYLSELEIKDDKLYVLHDEYKFSKIDLTTFEVEKTIEIEVISHKVDLGSNFLAFINLEKKLEYVFFDFSREIIDLPFEPNYETKFDVDDGYVILRNDKSVILDNKGKLIKQLGSQEIESNLKIINDTCYFISQSQNTDFYLQTIDLISDKVDSVLIQDQKNKNASNIFLEKIGTDFIIFNSQRNDLSIRNESLSLERSLTTFNFSQGNTKYITREKLSNIFISAEQDRDSTIINIYGLKSNEVKQYKLGDPELNYSRLGLPFLFSNNKIYIPTSLNETIKLAEIDIITSEVRYIGTFKNLIIDFLILGNDIYLADYKGRRYIYDLNSHLLKKVFKQEHENHILIEFDEQVYYSDDSNNIREVFTDDIYMETQFVTNTLYGNQISVSDNKNLIAGINNNSEVIVYELKTKKQVASYSLPENNLSVTCIDVDNQGRVLLGTVQNGAFLLEGDVFRSIEDFNRLLVHNIHEGKYYRHAMTNVDILGDDEMILTCGIAITAIYNLTLSSSNYQDIIEDESKLSDYGKINNGILSLNSNLMIDDVSFYNINGRKIFPESINQNEYKLPKQELLFIKIDTNKSSNIFKLFIK